MTEAEKIENKSALLREILLRFAAEALCVNNEGSRDGLMVTKTMAVFLNELKITDIFVKRGLLKSKEFTEFAENIFLNHKPWVRLFESVITVVKKMNSHKDQVERATETETKINQMKDELERSLDESMQRGFKEEPGSEIVLREMQAMTRVNNAIYAEILRKKEVIREHGERIEKLELEMAMFRQQNANTEAEIRGMNAEIKDVNQRIAIIEAMLFSNEKMNEKEESSLEEPSPQSTTASSTFFKRQ